MRRYAFPIGLALVVLLGLGATVGVKAWEYGNCRHAGYPKAVCIAGTLL